MAGQRAGRWFVGGIVFFMLMVVFTAIDVAGEREVPLWGYGLLWAFALGSLLKGVFNRFGVTTVKINPERFVVAKTLWGVGRTRSGRTAQIVGVEMIDRNKGKKDENGRELPPEEMVEIRTEWRYYGFGLSLLPLERLWVSRELRVFLREIGHPVD
jgi:hypothetical protein